MQDIIKKESSTGNIIDFVLLKRVLKFAKPYRGYFIIAVISAILLSFLGPARPLLINYAVDNYIVIPNQEALIRITLLLISILVLEGIVQFFYIYLSTWLGQNIIQDLMLALEKSINDENYEIAAKLRDRIKNLKTKQIN